MKEAINFAGPKVKIVESPIPEPRDNQVLIKVIVSGSNPKDWKVPDMAATYDGPGNTVLGKSKRGLNQGDDIAGIVEKVGAGVVEFKVSQWALFYGLRIITLSRQETVLQRSMKCRVQEVHMRSTHLHGAGRPSISLKRLLLKVSIPS